MEKIIGVSLRLSQPAVRSTSRVEVTAAASLTVAAVGGWLFVLPIELLNHRLSLIRCYARRLRDRSLRPFSPLNMTASKPISNLHKSLELQTDTEPGERHSVKGLPCGVYQSRQVERGVVSRADTQPYGKHA